MTNIEFDKKLTCGPEYVAVRIIENCEDLKVGNIWLTQKAEANGRLAFVKIEDVGHIAKEKYGIEAGEYALIDRLATFAHTAPVAALKYDSVICKSNSENNDCFPLRNMVFVEPDEKDDISNVGGIYVQNYAEKLRTGKIVKMNCDEDLKLPFKIGDRVLLTKGADSVQIQGKELLIYKHDMIVAKIED